MAKLNGLFEDFLSAIEPKTKAVEYAVEAHETVRKRLANDEKFGPYVAGSFLYGSYKRHTAVGDIKDVDIVILTKFNPDDPADTSQRVLRQLKAALARCYDDPENPQYQRRSIRIDDPLPDESDVIMTLDIIPAVAVNGEEEALKVPDRDSDEWVWGHPKAHIAATNRLNKPENSEKRFVPLVKMVKWWWKYQAGERQPSVKRPKPKGFWVELLTAGNFDAAQHDWADHFIAILENISWKYTDALSVPALSDPGLPGVPVQTSMTLDEFNLFMEAVRDSLDLARKARDEEDKVASSKLWRDIFGDKFPLYDEEETQESHVNAIQVPLGSTRHIEPLRWPLALSNQTRVRVDAFTYRENKELGGLNSDRRLLVNGLHIKFVAKTNVSPPYEVYWQVANTGPHAAQENGLRGDFFKAKFKDGEPSISPLVNWEHTEYTGKHWIECFIIKDGCCVARSSRFFVNVRNPAFFR